MDDYGKVFRNKKDNTLIIYPYDPTKDRYYEMIKSVRDKGYNQLIINSELMVKIIYFVLQKNGILKKIIMSNNTDQDIIDNIDNIVKKLKKDRLLFSELKDQLEWAIDSGSIDVDSIEIYTDEQSYTIKSNGIIYGEGIEKFFESFIHPAIRSYFNE